MKEVIKIFQEKYDWTPYQEELVKKIRSKKYTESAIELALRMHAMVHFKSMLPNNPMITFWDDIWCGLTDEQLAIMPSRRDNTIAWCLWHITRIEDIVSNLLIDQGNQIFNEQWKADLNVSISDTGNAMTDSEMLSFSQQVNKQQLVRYSNTVGLQTQTIIRSLTADKLKLKPTSESLERIIEEGALINHKNSIWLKDFWGKKTIAGLVLLPLTRHHVMHLNEAVSMRERILVVK